MMEAANVSAYPFHSHVFLGEGHETSERRTWAVIWLCGAMMIAEIFGGLLFGSIALVADGLHMSTHAGALLLAALAYTYARKHAQDQKFTFGTGKLGDLAGFTSAIILSMIALLIAYESLTRLIAPVPIQFSEAIPIACAGLAVNIVSAWLLSGGSHHRGHRHGHGHSHETRPHEDQRRAETSSGTFLVEIFEDGVPPRFRIQSDGGLNPPAQDFFIETLRPDGARQRFAMKKQESFLESIEEIPEPHEFTAFLSAGGEVQPLVFQEHEHAHGLTDRDNNMRAALNHVAADAAVSVLVILGLLLAYTFNWLWMDPLVGIIGACVIANWAFGLVQDTGAILLDITPDSHMAGNLRQTIESDGDEVADLHLWRLGPGHLGAIISVVTNKAREADYYHQRLARFSSLSHLTVEIQRRDQRVQT